VSDGSREITIEPDPLPTGAYLSIGRINMHIEVALPLQDMAYAEVGRMTELHEQPYSTDFFLPNLQ
jgi:hypothetical protein